MTSRMVEVTLERSETQKIGSYEEEHREGPVFGRIPDDDGHKLIMNDRKNELSIRVEVSPARAVR